MSLDLQEKPHKVHLKRNDLKSYLISLAETLKTTTFTTYVKLLWVSWCIKVQNNPCVASFMPENSS